MRKPSGFWPPRFAEIHQRLVDGASAADIAATYDVLPVTMAGIIVHYGLRRPGPWVSKDKNRAIKLAEARGAEGAVRVQELIAQTKAINDARARQAASRKRTFEDLLEAVRRGETEVRFVPPMRRPDYAFSLTGDGGMFR